jgi:DNA-binding GntR family transcriptional regulator
MAKPVLEPTTTDPAKGRLSLSDRVVVDLRRDIISGRFAQGERLTEARLCAEYGVSRVPVREALRTMEGEGFVVATSFTDRVVAQLDEQDSRDVYAVRIAVEGQTAARAASRADPEGRQELVRLLNIGMERLASGDLDQVAEINSRFHAAIAKASGSPLLKAMFNQFAAIVAWQNANMPDARTADSWVEHADIVSAIIAGDPQKARERMEGHLRALDEQAERQFAALTPAEDA